MISDKIHPHFQLNLFAWTVKLGMLLIPFLNGAKQRDTYRDQPAGCDIVRIVGTVALRRPAKPRGASG
jgi:hypothetical protein